MISVTEPTKLAQHSGKVESCAHSNLGHAFQKLDSENQVQDLPNVEDTHTGKTQVFIENIDMNSKKNPKCIRAIEDKGKKPKKNQTARAIFWYVLERISMIIDKWFAGRELNHCVWSLFVNHLYATHKDKSDIFKLFYLLV